MIGSLEVAAEAPTGEIRVHRRFRSKQLPHDRKLLVYLPPNYARERVRRYPVLYLHDGQNLFDHPMADGMPVKWCVERTATRLILSEAVVPLIIVGIGNTGEHRIDEYTPTRDEQRQMGGLADDYGRLIVEELKPFIDARYRTLRDPVHTGLGGSSLGGLVSMYLGLRYPDVFRKLGVVSPSVWWDNRAIVREVRALPRKPPLQIWLSAGTAEGRGVIPNTRRLRNALIRRGWLLGDDLQYFEARDAGHNEHAWAAIVDPMLRYLFPARQLSAIDWSGIDRL